MSWPANRKKQAPAERISYRIIIAIAIAIASGATDLSRKKKRWFRQVAYYCQRP
jgi:hypothetical protein